MNELFHANFARLLRDKVFWLISGVLLVYAIVSMWNGCRQEQSGLAGKHFLEDYYFQFAALAGLFSAVFSTLYLSAEYDGGALRNKVVVGHTRACIYLSNLFLVFFASLFMACMGCLGGLVGIPVFGGFYMGGTSVLCYLLIMVAFLFAFSAVFTTVAMLLPNRAANAVVTILIFFLMLFVASGMLNRLAQPETVHDTFLSDNTVAYSEPVPNPRYVDGMAREVLDFAIDLLPAGQGMRLAMGEVIHPVRMMLLSVLFSAGMVLCGVFLFGRKDLK